MQSSNPMSSNFVSTNIINYKMNSSHADTQHLKKLINIHLFHIFISCSRSSRPLTTSQISCGIFLFCAPFNFCRMRITSGIIYRCVLYRHFHWLTTFRSQNVSKTPQFIFQQIFDHRCHFVLNNTSQKKNIHVMIKVFPVIAVILEYLVSRKS